MATYLFPNSNLFFVPYAGNIVMPTGLGCDKCRLGDEERTGNTSPLSVVIDSKLVVDMIFSRSETSERREHNAMLKGRIADLKRGEEPGCRH